jgi:hypothetical protein
MTGFDNFLSAAMCSSVPFSCMQPDQVANNRILWNHRPPCGIIRASAEFRTVHSPAAPCRRPTSFLVRVDKTAESGGMVAHSNRSRLLVAAP